ncbi:MULTISPECIES: hypothetical protein [unclassified Bacillus (in: firmicutes)]|jgi:hypothetical protein|uniref:hypothetical protein n=1 Tax=unclassified Bacillus (in: firmicutes) TaxID=185979 RepID=UPI001BE55108|nr:MULTISPECIES: hypothetical protein [unclassified Bacillus (in: firmicutes)]MBT2685373.1 hypothetical protein [Bacillus sp. ISL-37]MBT2693620.1 hypothetical protein [Bacillus sp. ISL-55]
MVKMANRYIELIDKYQSMLDRDLTIEEIQFVKWVVAKEFNQHADYTFTNIKEKLIDEAPVLSSIM